MPRRSARPRPEPILDLPAHTRTCPARGGPLRAADMARRTAVTPEGPARLRLRVRSRRDPECPRRGACPRPEREGRYAPPQHEFGRDVIAAVGRPRHAGRRGGPEIHAEPIRRGAPIRARSAGHLPGRHDELRALSCSGSGRLRAVTAEAGRVILAVDGLRPDVGHEVLRAIRDVLSGEGLLAGGPLPSPQDDPAGLPREGTGALEVPIARVVSDGRASIRRAIAAALPGAPHRRCRPHCLRGAASPVDGADRRAEGRMKEEVRAIRPIERQVEGRRGAAAGAIRGSRAAVRPAPTDDGRPPPEASGSKLRDRPAGVADGPDRVGARRGSRRS